MKTYLLSALLSVLVLTMLFQVSPARPVLAADTYECTRLTLADDGITVTEIETIPCPAAPVYITEDDPRWSCAVDGNRICGEPMHYASVTVID